MTSNETMPEIKLNKRETKALAKLPADAVALYMTMRQIAAFSSGQLAPCAQLQAKRP